MSARLVPELLCLESAAPVLDAVGDAVVLLDESQRVVWLNGPAAMMAAALGLDAPTVVGRELAELASATSIAGLYQGLTRQIEEARRLQQTQTLMLNSDQVPRPMRLRVVPCADGVAIVARERSEEQALQQVHEQHEQRYRALFDAIPVPLVVFARDSATILAVNHAALAEFGGHGELVGAAVSTLLQADELPRFARERQQQKLVAQSQGVWRLRCGNDSLMVGDVTTFDLRFAGQGARLAMIRDITESKRIEADLQLLRAAIGCINDLIVITHAESSEDGTHQIVFVNEAFERHTGWSRDEVIGMSSTLLDGPRTDRSVIARVHEHLKRGASVRADILHYTKEGCEYWAELVIVPVYDGAGLHTHWVAVHRDISERKQLEEQLFQSQKMEAVGRLAGGIAHDFNNVLTAISGFSELLLEELPAGDGPHEEVQQIRAAAARATSLTRQLLAFSRKQIMRPRLVNVSSLVRDMERLLERAITEEITIRMHMVDRTPPVLADPVQLEQVLLNLTVNAAEAMPDGGVLTIEVSDVALGESYAHRHHGVLPGHYICLVVSDSGVGMDRLTRERIFEPFFTTKTGGTGLGLSTVYGIVRQSGGHIWVYSEAGVGSTFKIYLPVGTGEAPVEPENVSETEAVGGSETVLIVEDEALVRDVTRAMLTRRGYRVLVAKDGENALVVAASHMGVIDLLLTDVIMPRANGRRVAEQLRMMRPELRVVYMSGYTEDAIVHHGVLEAGIVLLEKPFTEQALARTVREVLDTPADSM